MSPEAELDVDVVVVTFNSAAHVGDCLDALPRCASVVVVDNASTDASIDVARERGVTVVASDANAGFAAAANRGAATGSAEHILFLNPDAVIGPADLRRLLAELERDGSVAVVGPSLRQPDGTEQRPSWPLPSARRTWAEAIGIGRLASAADADQFVIGAAFLIRRAVFEALGGFDARFWLYAEESDLCRRAIDAGWAVRLVPDAVARHVGGASAVDHERVTEEHFNRGLELYIHKHEGPVALLAARVALLIGSIVRCLLPGSAERRRIHRERLGHVGSALLAGPFTVALDSPATAAVGKGLVVCSLEPWDEVWRRNQFLVRELLELDPNLRILFVEPPFDWLLELRSGRDRRRARGLRPLEDDGRIVRFEPGKVWPRILGPFANRSLDRQVRNAANRLGLRGPTLWVNDSTYAGLSASSGWPTLYDITDDWTHAADSRRATDRVVTNERRLLRSSGSVVVCSDDLARTRRARRHDLHVIPNAVDTEHLTAPQPRPSDLPAGPVAVYVGTLHLDRLDVDLIGELAARAPELTVVLVGPSSLPRSVSDSFARTSNVVELGPRPYATVPAYLQHADVVIVPHVVTPFTESLDPIKAYECLAVGRPTVATAVAGFRDLGPPVVVAADRQAFVDAVRAAVARPVPSAPQPVASWADRAIEFRRALDEARAATDPDRPISVVFVDHCAKLSGGELALARVLPYLGDVRSHVILGEDGPLVGRIASSGTTVEVLALPQRLASTHRDEVSLTRLGADRVLTSIAASLALARRLRQIQPDLVHTNSLKAALYGGLAGRLAGIPVVWHIRDRIAPDYLPAPVVAALRLLVRIVPAAVITNSRATRETLGHQPLSSVIASPVIHDSVHAGDDPHQDRRPGPFRIAMVGRLAEWKGQHVFVDAVALAFPERDVEAVIVGSAMFGETAYEDRLVRLIDERGLGGQVRLVGFVDDIPALLADVDCLVHASIVPEPFGQVVVEGMAAGLPVIASDAGGPAEIITDCVDGFLSPPGDAARLAAVLSRLRSDPDERARVGRAALATSLTYSPESVGAKVTAVYRKVLRR